jgi:alpha-beta hydrolase superfamily lysophospholipase
MAVTARDGLRLPVGAFPAAGEGPVVLICHGLASHMGWYRPLALELQRRGCSVYTPDRRGTGRAGGSPGHMRSWRLVVDDLQRVADECARRHPGRPLHLLGISLGAVFAAAALLERPERFASLLASAPGFASRVKLPLRRRVRLLKRSWLKPERRYDLPFGMSTLTDRKDWQAALAGDPLRTRRVTARFLVEMFRMQQTIGRRIGSLKRPLLVALAGSDKLIDNEAVLRLLTRASRKAAMRVEIFEGASHILPACRPHQAFHDRLQRWFEEDHLTVASVPSGPWGPQIRRGLQIVRIQSEPGIALPPPPVLGAVRS